MVHFKTCIKKFGNKGEKTGWYYIDINKNQASILKPGNRKPFRVKGTLDQFKIEKISLLPMGEGHFIMALNATTRKGVGKQLGGILEVKIEEDKSPVVINKEFLECLSDEPAALAFFNTLAAGHRNYFSKWIESAKTNNTKEKRIAMAVTALAQHWDYGFMIRMSKRK